MIEIPVDRLNTGREEFTLLPSYSARVLLAFVALLTGIVFAAVLNTTWTLIMEAYRATTVHVPRNQHVVDVLSQGLFMFGLYAIIGGVVGCPILALASLSRSFLCRSLLRNAATGMLAGVGVMALFLGVVEIFGGWGLEGSGPFWLLAAPVGCGAGPVYSLLLRRAY